MDIINNRYRIIQKLNQNEAYSTYVVEDIVNNYNEVKISILNSEYVSNSFIRLCNENFIELSNIKSSNINKLYNYGLVNLIDNNKIEERQYYFTSEHFKEYESLYLAVKKLHKDNILHPFIEICHGLNYLHLKGFIYNNINLDNILMVSKENQEKIILKDIPTAEIEKNYYWENINENDYFKAPELNKGHKPDVISDIYSLGILLLCLYGFNIDELKEIKPSEELVKYFYRIQNNDKYSKFDKSIMKIINKMIDKKRINRYQNVNEVVEDINHLFNTNYRAQKNKELEKLNFNFDLIGRDEELREVIQTYNDIKYRQEKNNLILIHGEAGIGKTKLLRSIEYRLDLMKSNIYSSYKLDAENINNNDIFVEILRKFVAESNTEILTKYESELIKFIPELGLKKSITPTEPLAGNKESLRLINRTAGFISELTKNQVSIFIIDNFHLADKFTIDFFEYLLVNNKENILFIISYTDGECELNSRFTKFLEDVKFRISTKGFLLKGFKLHQTAKMIKNILHMSYQPINIASEIQEKTLGNPLFIEEIIKNLFANGIIYIDEESGLWSTKFDISEIPMPENIRQAVLNQINGIDNFEYSILATIAIFKKSISIDIISKFTKYNKQEIKISIENLVAKGLLCKKIEDRGFTYDFYSKFLKNFMYERIDIKDRKLRHELCVELLESEYNQGEEDYLQELIYHLERCDQKQKIIDYCLKNAEKMIDLRSRKDAIDNLEKALSIYNDSTITDTKLKIITLLAETYNDDENYDLAEYYFKMINQFAKKSNDHIRQIDALNKISSILLARNKIDEAKNIVTEIEEKLLRIEYIKGYIECSYTKSIIYVYNMQFQDCIDLCRENIELCGQEYLKYKAEFYNILGNVYIQTSETNNAIESFEKSIALFEECKYTRGILKALNNIGVIYSDVYQDYENALFYYNKIVKISKEGNFVLDEIRAKSNTGSVYFNHMEYKKAIEYLEDVIEICNNNNFQSELYYAYLIIANCYIKLRRFDKAFYYYNLCKDKTNIIMDDIRDAGELYLMEAELYFSVGELRYARKSIKKALKIFKQEDSILGSKSELLSKVINSYNDGSYMINDLSEIVNIINKYRNVEIKLNIMYIASIYFYTLNQKENSYKLFNDASKIIEMNNYSLINDTIKSKKFLVEALLSKHDLSKLQKLDEALKYSKKCGDLEIQYLTCMYLADYYLLRKEYYYALAYYFESCEMAKEIIISIPDKYKKEYVNMYKLIEPFKKYFNVLEYFSKNKQYKISINSISKIEELNEIFKQVKNTKVIKDKDFVEYIRGLYNSFPYENIKECKDVLGLLKDDDIYNIDLINRFIAYISLASRSLIVTEENGNIKIIAASDGNDKSEQYVEDIIMKTKGTKKPTLVKIKASQQKVTINETNDLEAYICIPIKMNGIYNNDFARYERRRYNLNKDSILGYIFVESKRVINNFNQEILEEIMVISNLIGIIIEKINLRYNAAIDRLTGTLTRKYLEISLKEIFERANYSEETFSILMFDLDNFKGVNDNYGHQTGDMVLARVCEVVRNNIRHTDVFGRYGGEEFIVILPNINLRNAEMVAEKLRRKVIEADILRGKRDVTISIGIASYPEHAQWSNELIEKVDQALYSAKSSGKNQYKVWNSKYSDNKKRGNKLSGIITGNSVQDERNALTIVELIELINSDINNKDKIYRFLGRIIETTEAERGILLTVENGELQSKYCREIMNSDWIEDIEFNQNIVTDVIRNREGIYIIDWDNVIEYNKITGIPDWKSVLCVPIIKNHDVKAVLYLSVSTQKKEFNFDDFNLVNVLSKLIISTI